MTPGGALRAREPTPGPGAGEEGAFRRRGAGGRRSRDAAERGRASRARGGAAPALETDSETLGRGGLSDRPAGSAAAEWPTGAPTPGRPAGDGEMNGFSTEEDSREGPPAAPAAAPGYGQSCCLIEDGERCVRPAGNASFSKRVQKSISQKKLKLDIDKSVSPRPRQGPRARALPAAAPELRAGLRGPPRRGPRRPLSADEELDSGFQRPFRRRPALLSLGFCPNGGGWAGAPTTLPAWED